MERGASRRQDQTQKVEIKGKGDSLEKWENPWKVPLPPKKFLIKCLIFPSFWNTIPLVGWIGDV